MKFTQNVGVGIACLLLACTEGPRPPADVDLQGKVVRIADGDTFTLLTPDNRQVRVRLHGIDAPEKGQDFGQASRQKLSELIFGKEVGLDEKEKDRYGRTIAVVYDAAHRNINEEMLKAGLVWHYTAYDRNSQWSALEEKARRQRLGLWAQPSPTPPWQWRKERRAN